MANDTTDLTKYQSFLTEGDIGYQDPYLGLADPGIKYDPRDQKYASDLYSYYLAGGTGVPPVDAAGSTVQVPGTADRGTGDGGGTGLPIGVMPPLDSQFEQNLEYQGTPGGDVGSGEFGLIDSSGKDYGPYTKGITQDPMTGDARIAEQIAAQDRQDIFNQQFDYEDAKTQALRGTDPIRIGPDTILPEARPVTGAEGLQGTGLDTYDEAASLLSGEPLQNVTGQQGLGTAGNVAAGLGAAAVGLGGAASAQTMSDIALINQMAKQYNLSTKNPATPQMLSRLKGAWVPNETFEKLGHGKGSTAKWLTSRVSPAHFGPVEAGIKAAKATPGALLATAPLDLYVAGAEALQKNLEGKGLTGEGGIYEQSGYADPMSAGADIDPKVDARLRDRTVNPFEETMAAEAVPTLEDMARDSQYGTYMPEQAPGAAPTLPGGYEVPADRRMGADYADTGTPMGPDMADVAGPVQNITLPSGDVYAANDPQLLEKVDPETKTNTNMIAGLWDTAAGSATNFKNSLMDKGFTGTIVNGLVNAFTGGTTGKAGITGAIISALSKGVTQVSSEQKAANAAFEQKHGISVGDDGRITSGIFAGKVPAGKSFAGSADYGEMIDTKIDYFEDRIEEGKSYSKEKYQEALDFKAKEEGTYKEPDFYTGTDEEDKDIEGGAGIVEEATDGNISTAEIRDLANSGDLGQVARTDENISKAVDVLAEQYDQQRGPHEDPTVTSKVSKAKAQINMPQHLGDVGQKDPTGGRDEPAPTGTSGAPGGGDPGMRSAPSAPSAPSGPPAGGPHGGGGNGGSGNGGGKIVCTMMNDSYGFGSFRNKIWLRQSKNLAPEYQIGYHKIFLPLVKLAKKNIVLKKILEHIAIHRTIDIRQEARGKTHILGRIYRKVLEPICYWVGKNA